MRTVEPTERWVLYQELQEIAMDDVADYPLYWPLIGEAYSESLHIPDNLWNDFKRPIYYIQFWTYN